MADPVTEAVAYIPMAPHEFAIYMEVLTFLEYFHSSPFSPLSEEDGKYWMGEIKHLKDVSAKALRNEEEVLISLNEDELGSLNVLFKQACDIVYIPVKRLLQDQIAELNERYQKGPDDPDYADFNAVGVYAVADDHLEKKIEICRSIAFYVNHLCESIDTDN